MEREASMNLKQKKFGSSRLQDYQTHDLALRPAPAIMADGLGGVGHGQYWIEGASRRVKWDASKPRYRIPSMKEIGAVKPNGFKVVSTFSGCGGSCLGYRMAGFKIVWANEFVPAAQESYKANAGADCILDGRDIRSIQASEILAAIGLKKGELDLFDGSPPCQAFSTAGKRERNWGKEKRYEHGAAQCNETLFAEYVRLLRGLMPKVFIAENVSGLVKGTAKGMFLEILAELKSAGYTVECRLLDAQWLGVPQQRQRIIFQGVRNDLKTKPAWPSPLKHRYSVVEALPWISKVVHDTHGSFKSGGDITKRPSVTITTGMNGINSHHFKVEDATELQAKIWEKTHPGESFQKSGKQLGYKGGFSKIRANGRRPSPTITTAPDVFHPVEKRKFSIAEVKRLCSFPDDFVLVGSYAQQWERLGNSVPPVMMFHLASAIRDRVLNQCK